MKKAILITIICATALMPFYFQSCNTKLTEDPRGDDYAGSKACISCHSSIYHDYLHTAHYLASRPAGLNTVHGSFTPGKNIFHIGDNSEVQMQKLDSGLYQAYYLNGKPDRRYRFDIVLGGVKGESYLYWKANELYQLPLSYINALHQWSTSPGLGLRVFDYTQSRVISKQCLECHASYINDLPGTSAQLTRAEQFDKATLVYSIDCERCHGPGAKHVDFQSANPAVKTAKFITSYKSLTRQQKLDMCAVCHSGKPGVTLRSTFGFVPGSSLVQFKLPDFAPPVDTARLDVHGNQLQLLQSSKCYLKSKVMTCTTCHDVHQNSRGNVLLYAQKCLSCHNTGAHTFCTMKSQPSFTFMKANCISCHMPALPTTIISAQVSSVKTPIQFFVHTHRITIYP